MQTLFTAAIDTASQDTGYGGRVDARDGREQQSRVLAEV